MPSPSTSNTLSPLTPGTVLAVVVHDQQAFLHRLLTVLESSGIEVGTVIRPGQGYAAAQEVEAEVVVVACNPGDTKEAARVRRLRDALPEVALLLIVPAVLDPGRLIRRALSIGADGVVIERDLEQTLEVTVLALAAGQLVVPRAAYRSVRKPQLTYREKQVLALAVAGQTNAQIGARLYLAESTVKSHLSSAFRQLGVASRREAAALVLDPDQGLGLSVLALGGAQDRVAGSNGHDAIHHGHGRDAATSGQGDGAPPRFQSGDRGPGANTP
jgi:DNA-binding NarL/FixJ family response regulator